MKENIPYVASFAFTYLQFMKPLESKNCNSTKIGLYRGLFLGLRLCLPPPSCPMLTNIQNFIFNIPLFFKMILFYIYISLT